MTGPTIAFFPEASFGAALNCVGIAQALRDRGSHPVFICHPGFTGVFAEYGFQEFHLPGESTNGPKTDDYWQRFIQTHLPHFRQNAHTQLETYVASTWNAIVETVETVEDALSDLLALIRPDLVVLDNVIMFPAIARAGIPWVRVVSCAETEIPDANVPPYLSGLRPDDKEACEQFERDYRLATAEVHKRYNRFRKKQGLTTLERGIFLEPSPHLNLLLSPKAVRYDRKRPLETSNHVYLEGCVRNEAPFDPPHLTQGAGPLVYMSFGSLGAIDTSLIKRMITVFDDVPARFLVNVGGFLEDYVHVPDNVFLGSWFPQPSVVAECDLFIHHGGNNSFCEALYFGVPSLILPYCWDGFDNAQRVEAKELGKWLPRNDWREEDLRDAMGGLLNNTALKERLLTISSSMQADSGPAKAADCLLGLLDP